MKSVPGKRLYELDALRGFAALYVVFYHYTMNRPQSNTFLEMGFTSVDLFFLISGFVITMTLEQCRSGKEFLVKRFIRLYPSFWICMSITTLLLVRYGFEHFNRQSFIKYLANLTMFSPYLGQDNMDGAYWSLLTELCFYILVLMFFVWRKMEKIEWIVAGCLAALSALGIVTRFFPISAGAFKNLYTYATIVLMLPTLLAGMCFYRLMYKGRTIYRYLLIAGCLLTSLCIQHLDPRTALIGGFRFFAMHALYYSIFFLFVHGRLGFIVNRVTLFLGKISYPLYLLHMGMGLLIVIPNLNLYMPIWPAILLTIGIMMVTAFLVHILVEKPVQAFLKKKWLTKGVVLQQPEKEQVVTELASVVQP